MSKKKQIFRAICLSAIITFCIRAETLTVKAAEVTDEFVESENIVEFLDENGEVMAVFIPYSETNPMPVSLEESTTVNINLPLEANSQTRSSNTYVLADGDKIYLNITITPQASSNIGLFNWGTNAYGWPAGGLSSAGWQGVLEVNGNGTYSMAFKNNSNIDTNYVGTYTMP